MIFELGFINDRGWTSKKNMYIKNFIQPPYYLTKNIRTFYSFRFETVTPT